LAYLKLQEHTNQLINCYDNSFENQKRLLSIIGETEQPHPREQKNPLRTRRPSRSTEGLTERMGLERVRGRSVRVKSNQ